MPKTTFAWKPTLLQISWRGAVGLAMVPANNTMDKESANSRQCKNNVCDGFLLFLLTQTEKSVHGLSCSYVVGSNL